MKTETQKCPFCSQAREVDATTGRNHFDFDCTPCGRFFIYSDTLRRLNEGEDAAMRPGLLEFIKGTPPEEIAYFGHHFERNGDGPAVYRLYKKYLPIESIKGL